MGGRKPSLKFLLLMNKSLNFCTQEHSSYTAENLEVWKMLYQNLDRIHQQHASSVYLENKLKLGFCSNKIPNFEHINRVLGKTNGWQIVAVDGLVPTDAFFYLLSEKQFPVTPWIRPLVNAYSYDDADMLHDMLGHIPFLLDKQCTDFLHLMGNMVIQANYDEVVMEAISRIYWRTIEVGLVYEQGNPKIYGAALLSSQGESLRSVAKDTSRFPFSFKDCVTSSYFYDRAQDEYYIISGYSDFEAIIEQLQSHVIEPSFVNH